MDKSVLLLVKLMLATPVRRSALDYFLGVGGSGRRPVECPSPVGWHSPPAPPPPKCPTSEIAHLAAERSRIPPYGLFGGIRANRLASNFKTPPALAISNLAVYRAP